ncbi:FAD-dependent oxidoreductase [Embleya sp. AB8]|uniref:FAD-dependent oxidoreductase n=1 Tax=Embleya sp. AB8 TaxID=3156304 RepID=UPI003C721E25
MSYDDRSTMIVLQLSYYYACTGTVREPGGLSRRGVRATEGKRSMREMTATVVGGGIAGLAAAVSLARAGWSTTVLERSAGFGELGAGVALPRNGITALRSLGLDDDTIATLGHESLVTGFRNLRGRWILRIPNERPEVSRVMAVWGMHRARLHTALRAAAEAAGVRMICGARVSEVHPGTPGGKAAVVAWRTDDDEHRIECDLLVGADGMRSAVREQVFPGIEPAYSGSTSWRAVIPDTASDGNLIELWGPGAEFGAMRLSDSEIYWYGYFRHPRGATFADELAAARSRFAGWAPQAVDLVEATSASQLMRHDVYHLPGGLPSYVRGRVVMIGDAAHAALPTMGQGAATALEDGATVGRMIGGHLADGADLAAAMAAFDAERRPRCHAIARQATVMARYGADLGGGWRQPVRNALLRLVPGAAVARSAAPLVAWRPPATGS